MYFHQLTCPICSNTCFPLDVVDFNKSCEEVKGKFLALSEIPIYYFFCSDCQFCFAPEFSKWKPKEFEERIYNEDYVLVDPDYVGVRPRSNAQSLISVFGTFAAELRHLDFGGGNGLLSRILRESNWQSSSYDPFVDKEVTLSSLGRFDLITAFEVFEHTPDPCGLISNLSSLLESDGIVIFTTATSDGHIAPHHRINWWYASPRNGHISLFSKKSLALLGAREGFSFGSFSDVIHVFWRHVPDWARHLIAVA